MSTSNFNDIRQNKVDLYNLQGTVFLPSTSSKTNNSSCKKGPQSVSSIFSDLKSECKAHTENNEQQDFFEPPPKKKQKDGFQTKFLTR
jgi:hypothetical protein